MVELSADQLFERTILHELVESKEYFSKAFAILKADYFTENRKDIFELIKNHYLEYKAPPKIQDIAIKIKNIQNEDLRSGIISEVKGVLECNSPHCVSMLDETLKFAKDALYLQALEVGSEGLMTKSDKLKLRAEQILEERSKLNLDSDLGIEFQGEEIIDYYDEEMQGLLTQHKSLNFRLGPGITEGTLTLLAAASGVGKSLMMTDLITGWIKDGKNILLVSLEMSAKEVMKRVHSNTLNIPIADLSPGNFNKDIFRQKLKESKSKGYGTFYAKDFPALTFGSLQLEALIESYKNEKGIKFDKVLVDYMGIMKSDLLSPSAGLYSYAKSIAEELRSVAVRTHTRIMSASQLNRGATNNLDSDNSAISDSYGTLMTADFLMFLLQTEEMKTTGDIICKITKNRFSGITESFPMKVDYTYMRFVDPVVPMSFTADTKTSEFMDDFIINKKATDAQLRDIQQQDHKLVKEFDAKHKLDQVPKEDMMEVPESKTLDELLKDFF